MVEDEKIIKFLIDRNEEGLKLLDEFYKSFLTLITVLKVKAISTWAIP